MKFVYENIMEALNKCLTEDRRGLHVVRDYETDEFLVVDMSGNILAKTKTEAEADAFIDDELYGEKEIDESVLHEDAAFDTTTPAKEPIVATIAYRDFDNQYYRNEYFIAAGKTFDDLYETLPVDSDDDIKIETTRPATEADIKQIADSKDAFPVVKALDANDLYGDDSAFYATMYN